MFGGFDHLSNVAEAKARQKREKKASKAAAAAGATGGSNDEEGDGSGGGTSFSSDFALMKTVSARKAAADVVKAEVEAQERELAGSSPTPLPALLSEKKDLDDAIAKLTLGHDLPGGRKDTPMALDDLNAFFVAVRRKLRGPEGRSVLASIAAHGPALAHEKMSEVLVNMQRACFTELGVDVEHGCMRLGFLQVDYPQELELRERSHAFAELCRESYLTGLREGTSLRSSSSGRGVERDLSGDLGGLSLSSSGSSGKEEEEEGGSSLVVSKSRRSSHLQRSGTLSREAILVFITSCVMTLQSERGRRLLHAAATETQDTASGSTEAVVGVACLQLQYECLEELCGVERVFGVSKLNLVPTDFPADQELHREMQLFAQRCQEACARAKFTVEEIYAKEAKMIEAQLHEQAVEQEEAKQAGLLTEGEVTREHILAFFDKNFETLASAETKSKFKKLCKTPEGVQDLSKVMVEVQMSCFHQVGVSRKLGSKALANLQTNYGQDQEVMGRLKEFVHECSRAWLSAVKQANLPSASSHKNHKKLQNSGRLSRPQVLNFCEACHNLYMLPETREELRNAFLGNTSDAGGGGGDGGASEGGDMNRAAAVSVQMQRGLLEDAGIKAAFGVSCLNSVGRDYAKDEEVLQKFMAFQRSCQQVVQMSTLSDSELAARQAEATEQQRKAQLKQAMYQQKMQAVQVAASEMTEQDTAKLKAKMLPRWTTLQRLDAPQRQTYLDRQPDGDQTDFLLLSVVMLREKQQQAASLAATASASSSQSAPPSALSASLPPAPVAASSAASLPSTSASTRTSSSLPSSAAGGIVRPSPPLPAQTPLQVKANAGNKSGAEKSM
mmetsp:Transcript_4825/g.10230  ORF Transcript_4825/g.10230 Transcript_4825/m.10230 type:complete len:842 (+) Transcript_4825:35-2560(+)